MQVDIVELVGRKMDLVQLKFVAVKGNKVHGGKVDGRVSIHHIFNLLMIFLNFT
jgi:hypothetical protein